MKLGNFIDYFRRFCILPCGIPSNTYYLLLETFPHSWSHPWIFIFIPVKVHNSAAPTIQLIDGIELHHPFCWCLWSLGSPIFRLLQKISSLKEILYLSQIPRRKENTKKNQLQSCSTQWHPQKNIQKNKGKTMKSKENPRLPLEHSVPGCQKHLWPLERHFAHQTKHPWGSWWGASVRANISPTVQRWPPHTFESQRLTLIHGSSSIIYHLQNPSTIWNRRYHAVLHGASLVADALMSSTPDRKLSQNWRYCVRPENFSALTCRRNEDKPINIWDLSGSDSIWNFASSCETEKRP